MKAAAVAVGRGKRGGGCTDREGEWVGVARTVLPEGVMGRQQQREEEESAAATSPPLTVCMSVEVSKRQTAHRVVQQHHVAGVQPAFGRQDERERERE